MKKYIKIGCIISFVFMLIVMSIGNVVEAASKYYQTVKSGIAAFPESYQTRLKQLSNKYPNWKFQAYYTGIPWDELIKKERGDDSNHRNRVTVNAPASWKHCDFQDDGWACASDAAVKYYMDPRNFLNETQIFQFVETSYNEKVQTISAIKNSVKGTFLDATVTCKDFNNNMITKSYSEIIIDAAKKTNISAFYIKSKIIQEVGNSGSGSVTGTYPGYEGYYNFFNYGAYDDGDDIANGLAYAQQKGWDSQYKAIVGGAELIGKYYINQGQNTAYFNKWDVVGNKILKEGESQTVNEGDLFWHQYMTNIQDPTSQSYSTKKLYANSLNSEITFIIPVYENMPYSNPMPTDVPVTGISFEKNTLEININQKEHINAYIKPLNATNKDIIWSVSNPEILRIYNGDIRGLKEGNAIVTATTLDGGYTASCKIYVRDPNKNYVQNIKLEKEMYIINMDEAVDVNFSYSPENSVNAEFEWYSTDNEILRVYGPRFRGLKEGTAEIVVKTVEGLVEKKVKVVVRDPNKSYVQKMEIEKEEYNIAVNEAVDINFKYLPENSVNAEFEWTTTNEDVIRVWGPRIRGLQEGEAELIGRTIDGTVETRAKVYVKYENVKNIKPEQEIYVVNIGEKGTVGINFEPINASNQNLHWECSDSEIIRLYEGDFRGLKEGEAIITAISEDGGHQASCKIYVRDPNKHYVEKINLPYTTYEAGIDEAVDIDFSYSPKDSVNAEFEWYSTDNEILRVYGPRFRGLKEGTAEVVAKTVDGTVETRIKVNVKYRNVESIKTEKESYTIGINEKSQIKVNITPNNATNQTLYWQSSNPEVVRVYNGDIRGLKEGKSTITITSEDGGKIATCEVIVKDPNHISVDSIETEFKTYTVDINEKSQIKVKFNPSNAYNKKLYWESSEPEVVRVYEGDFRGLKEGKSTITITSEDGGKVTTCEVIVIDSSKNKVQSIETEFKTYTVGIDEKSQIKVKFNPDNAYNKKLYWESSNPEVVRVYEGDFRGLKEGKSTITITSEDGGKVTTCEVVVINKK